MDLGKLQYFEKIEKPLHREFINAHSNCVLCGTVLELQHIQLPEEKKVKEEAYCPTCNLRTRAKIHTLI